MVHVIPGWQSGVRMEPGEFAYIVETGKSFGEAVVSVLKSAERKGWALFQVYDISERLAAKGFEHEPLKIIEICSARHASRFIRRNRLASLCMPCRINVFREKGRTMIAGMRPATISRFFPEIPPEEAKEAERDIVEIIDGAR